MSFRQSLCISDSMCCVNRSEQDVLLLHTDVHTYAFLPLVESCASPIWDGNIWWQPQRNWWRYINNSDLPLSPTTKSRTSSGAKPMSYTVLHTCHIRNIKGIMLYWCWTSSDIQQTYSVLFIEIAFHDLIAVI